MEKQTVLVVGGLGFIGSHTVCRLINEGFEVVIIDDLSNADKDILSKINQITGCSIDFYQGCYANHQLLEQVTKNYFIQSVILFAGSKYVGESILDPLLYYQNNIANLISFAKFIEKTNISKLVFSSSASVYGDIDRLPVKEDAMISPISPYARTKAMAEAILMDLSAVSLLKVSLLRYFNPMGAHNSGLLGEVYCDKSSNLMANIIKTIQHKQSFVPICGDDFPTPDGTGIRDYIHVMDLADGHIAALKGLDRQIENHSVYNLGTGRGYSVLEVLDAFSRVTGKDIATQLLPKRVGDIAISYADVSRAKKSLHWQAKYSLEDMCRDIWRYYQ